MQLSKLIVNTFDNPSSPLFQEQRFKHDGNHTMAPCWTDQERIETEKHTIQEYTNNVQRLRGYKYSLWIAKEYHETDTTIGWTAKEGKVVGVVEVGVTKYTRRKDTDKRPTIGILCVDPKYQALGVGSALIDTCESLVLQMWKDTSIYVQVEPWNIRALRFFYKRGYRLVLPDEHQGNEANAKTQTMDSMSLVEDDPSSWITVRLYRNRILQDVPHVLMMKELSEY
jgi:ribosomal protein S18 acetylase RimI-like enzyme